MNKATHEALKIVISLAKYETDNRKTAKVVFKRAITIIEKWAKKDKQKSQTNNAKICQKKLKQN